MTGVPSVIALIPARAGSQRIPNKNIRELNGHPLLAYTIAAARESGVFDHILLMTDSLEYATIATKYGAEAYPRAVSNDLEPDYAWVSHSPLMDDDCFAILRPTSPFRTADTIRRAWQQWCEMGDRFDSLRAVELCKQHPGKMWVHRQNGQIDPLITHWPDIDGQPPHSRPYQSLPNVHVQNASLEIAWTRVLKEHGNISGKRVMGFVTKGYEGFDLNTEDDWRMAELLIERGLATLPEVKVGT